MPEVTFSEGDNINGFIIDKKLGEGRYGAVFKVYADEDSSKSTPYCLKFSLSADDAYRDGVVGLRYFRRCSEVYPGELSVPGENAFFPYQDGHICLIPYIQGETFVQALQDERLTLRDYLDISISLIEQAVILKSLKQLHRDTHEENAMVYRKTCGTYAVCMIDFGLALDLSVTREVGEVACTHDDYSPSSLSFRRVFDDVLRFHFLSETAMKFEKYAKRLAPEHRTISSVSKVGFRSDAFGMGYMLSVVADSIMKHLKTARFSSEKIKRIEQVIKQFTTIIRGLRAPNIEDRTAIEEAYIELCKTANPERDSEEVTAEAITRLNALMGTKERVIASPTHSCR